MRPADTETTVVTVKEVTTTTNEVQTMPATKKTKESKARVAEMREKRRAARTKASKARIKPEDVDEMVAQKVMELRMEEIKVEMERELEKTKVRMERKARALQAGVSAKQQLDYDDASAAVERLKKAGLVKPGYEDGSAKTQLRLPMAWKEAMLAEAKRRGISQSELMRQGIKKMLPREIANDLEEVYPGKRLS